LLLVFLRFFAKIASQPSAYFFVVPMRTMLMLYLPMVQLDPTQEPGCFEQPDCLTVSIW
jgi:hypothetical protein